MRGYTKKRRKVQPSIHPSLIEPIRQELAKCHNDPARFNAVFLCRELYWKRQMEVARSVTSYAVTAVKAGNAVGKSYLAAGIVWWFAVTRPRSRIVVAAPTQAQLKNVLWAEIQRAHALAGQHGMHLGGRFDGLSIDFGEGWLIEGFGQGSVESSAGRHAGNLLAVIDEASGVKPSVLEAIDSLNPSHRLYIGNPLRPEGKFFEVCERPGQLSNVITIPSLESPDIGLERSPRGMADATWLQLSRDEYGEESQWWQSHVLAQFPGELTSTLLPWAWLQQATGVKLEGNAPGGPVRIGVDLAKGEEGDNSQITVRNDLAVLETIASNRWGLEDTAKQVKALALRYSVVPTRITYDATGLGTDFSNRLAALGLSGAKDFVGSRSGGEKFGNLRTAAAWALRRRFDPQRYTRGDGGSLTEQRPFHLPQHILSRYAGELRGLRYGLDDMGRVCLERKEDFQLRLKHSPNFVDSLAMTFAYPHA